MTPKWTVLFNIHTKDGLHRAYEFYASEAVALASYHAHSAQGHVPTCRPFHETDRVHLGE